MHMATRVHGEHVRQCGRHLPYRLFTVRTAPRIYLTFLLSASAFLNGNPLVLLSAPVFLLILPLLLANKMHHSATVAKKPEPSVPRLNDVTPVLVHMAYP